ncbi:MAG TPA: hypothetical protein VNX68_16245 [Nitrosopumilaceae archaeon]|jgi:hypothetical protein|nr:hypothetical protein [Nitrosopumilaceae archaeon]
MKLENLTWKDELTAIFRFREGDIVRKYTDIHTDIEYFIKDLLAMTWEQGYQEGRKSKKSQQQLWQEKQMKLGRCAICGKKSSKTSKYYCEYHRAQDLKNSAKRRREKKLLEK